ncbi:unnamed protein product [Closterium sp. Naga37s-1]|nr:unnamed protein product [Closterium sp. Naga37s-1]
MVHAILPSLAARYLSYHIPSIPMSLRTHPSSRPPHPPPHNRLSAASHRLLPARAISQVTDTPILNPSGQLVGVIGVSADISDIKRKEGEIRALNAALEERIVERTEQLQHNSDASRSRDLEQSSSRTSQQSLVLERIVAELRESRTEAESANRLKSRFLASMSYGNRTPMNGVLGMTLLLLLTPLLEEQHGFVETIHSSRHALLAILNDIQDLSKIEAVELEMGTATSASPRASRTASSCSRSVLARSGFLNAPIEALSTLTRNPR